ncbi:hypothetical protein GOV14_02955 [Candidatus Pacearchaeota archaeon]|nr:hypothetical protein [Candidatus Pacearchaeota archaeon]
MNKIKKIANLNVIISCVLLIFLLIPQISSDLIQKDKYVLNEKIKLDLRNIENYKLKIITPNNHYILHGSNDVRIFEPNMAGKYKIEIKSNEINKVYNFEVFKEDLYEKERLFEQETSLDKDLIQEDAEINKPVKWRRRIRNKSTDLPKIINFSFRGKSDYSKKIKYKLERQRNKNVLEIDEIEEGVEIEYFTEPPRIIKKNLSSFKKQVEVYSPENLHYKNILVYTEIEELAKNKNQINVYWKEEDRYLDFEAFDLDSDGLIDKVEWIVPHLSNQTFEIIIITRAEHRDENRNFVSDIYDELRLLDNVWSEIIVNDHFVRVFFETNLTSKNDITVFPRVVSGRPKIEVYEKDKNEIIAEFNNLENNEYNKVYLTNLKGSQDIFDLRIVGGNIEFDHIIDPPAVISWVEPISAITLNGGTTKQFYIRFNVSGDNLNASTAKIEISYNEETRNSSSCVNSSSANQFNCTIIMQFFDSAGSWNINASIQNTTGSIETNNSINFTVNALDYVSQDISAISWASVTSGTNDQEAAAAMVLTNGGNQNYTNISIKGFDATGASNGEVIFAENFSVDPDTSQTVGQTYMNNNTYTDVSVLNGLTNYGSSSTENIYFYVDTTFGLRADTFTSDSSWSILVST